MTKDFQYASDPGTRLAKEASLFFLPTNTLWWNQRYGMVHCRAENTSLNLAVCWIGLQKTNRLMVSNVRPKCLYIDIGWVCLRQSCSHQYPVQSCSPKFRPSHITLSFVLKFFKPILFTFLPPNTKPILSVNDFEIWITRKDKMTPTLCRTISGVLSCLLSSNTVFHGKIRIQLCSAQNSPHSWGTYRFSYHGFYLNGNFPFLSKMSKFRLFWRSDVTCGLPDLWLSLTEPERLKFLRVIRTPFSDTPSRLAIFQLFSLNPRSWVGFCRERNSKNSWPGRLELRSLGSASTAVKKMYLVHFPIARSRDRLAF